MQWRGGGSTNTTVSAKTRRRWNTTPVHNLESTAKLMYSITGAIAYLHAKDPPILHRDIKPENILKVGDTYILCDFGWSNTDSKGDTRNTFCGTPDYLSPEMILGTGHDEKLDVWTLGVLMYELLHGYPPFTP